MPGICWPGKSRDTIPVNILNRWKLLILKSNNKKPIGTGSALNFDSPISTISKLTFDMNK